MAPVAVDNAPIDTVSQLKQPAVAGPPLPKWQSPSTTKQNRECSDLVMTTADLQSCGLT